MSIEKSHIDPAACNDDRSLWNSLRAGDKQAFEQVYRLYKDDLYNYGVYVFMDNALVEDAIQDVFVELWRRKSFFGETDSIQYYLYASLKRNIVRKLKAKERVIFQHAIMGDDVYAESVEANIIADQSSVDRSETIRRAITLLPDQQRKIIIYKFFDNLSSKEISSRMSISLDSTYTLMSRALRELRKKIQYVYLIAFCFAGF